MSGDPVNFFSRLNTAQQTYASFTADPRHLYQGVELGMLGSDVVASFFAQAKSLLDSRRTFDIGLASRCVPWMKQIGANLSALSQVHGAADRVRRMLLDQTTEPDSVLFELVMAGNYAANGENIVFVEEQPGIARTPDLRLFVDELPETAAIELKRLRRGEYEIQERRLQERIFSRVADILDTRSLSLHIDVNYIVELKNVPESYLSDWLQRFLLSSYAGSNHYSWHDEFGFGEISLANVDAVFNDVRDTSLYIGTKFARLLAGRPVREYAFQLAAGLNPDPRDPRFFDHIHYGSVVTWQCVAPLAIERKARHVKSKLIEAARQVKTDGVGMIHLAMDVEVGCESSDLRRQKNKDVIAEFRAESPVAALYVHYLVPRISELHSWILDETVDSFAAGTISVPPMMVFSSSTPLGNDLPAWQQKLDTPAQ